MGLRDSYGNIPKRRVALLDPDGNIEPLSVTGEDLVLKGQVTLASNTATVSGVGIKSTSAVVVTPKHGGPTAVNATAYAGHVTISGTGNGLVSYVIFC